MNVSRESKASRVPTKARPGFNVDWRVRYSSPKQHVPHGSLAYAGGTIDCLIVQTGKVHLPYEYCA